MHEAGNQDYARRYFGLTPERIAERTLQVLGAERAMDGTSELGKRPARVAT
jgi:hypothetical protein